MGSQRRALTEGGRVAFGDSDDDDALFDEEMCRLLGSTVANLHGLTGGDRGTLGPSSSGPGAGVDAGGTLKWDAAGGLARAARVQRGGVGAGGDGGVVGRGPVQHSTGVTRVPTSMPWQPSSACHQLPQQSAQVLELQRQVEQYRQQLMFAQQELDVSRQVGERRGLGARHVGYGGHGGHGGRGGSGDVAEVGELARAGADVERTVGLKRGNPEREDANSPSVTMSTYNTYNTSKESSVRILPEAFGVGGLLCGGVGDACANVKELGIVGCGMHRGRVGMRENVPLPYRLDRLERDIASLKLYRRARREMYSIKDEQRDVAGWALVNLEAVLCPFGVDGEYLMQQRANVRDICVMLLSVMAYVLGTDAEMVLGRMGEDLASAGLRKGVVPPTSSGYNETNGASNGGATVGAFPTEVACTVNACAMQSDGGSGASCSPKAAQRCVDEFLKFVGSLFTIINELMEDMSLLRSMIDELTPDDEVGGYGVPDGADGSNDIRVDTFRTSKRAIAQNILRALEVLARLDASWESSVGCSVSTSMSSPSSSPTPTPPKHHAVTAVAQFLHALARLRSEDEKGILMPILKSKQLQQVILLYPGTARDELLKFTMVMLEDVHTFAGMEMDAAKELQVTPSKLAVGTSAQLKTPSKHGVGISGVTRPRRHSLINRRLGIETDVNGVEDENTTVGDPRWASHLTQTISICMMASNLLNTTSSMQFSSWTTVRLCLSFFAGLLERCGDALLQSVVDFKHLEKYDEGSSNETLMHHLVAIAGMAAGEGNLLYPQSCSETDLVAQRRYLQNRRVVHESLVLLRALLMKVPGTTRVLALQDSSVALCMLERVARYEASFVDEPVLTEGPLALWVDALDPGYGKKSRLHNISKALKSLLLKELTNMH